MKVDVDLAVAEAAKYAEDLDDRIAATPGTCPS